MFNLNLLIMKKILLLFGVVFGGLLFVHTQKIESAEAQVIIKVGDYNFYDWCDTEGTSCDKLPTVIING